MTPDSKPAAVPQVLGQEEYRDLYLRAGKLKDCRKASIFFSFVTFLIWAIWPSSATFHLFLYVGLITVLFSLAYFIVNRRKIKARNARLPTQKPDTTP
jgi:hypothetical protein